MKKYLPLLFIGFLFFAPKAHAAITLDHISTSSVSYAGTASTSVTVGSGSNQVLFAIQQENGGSTGVVTTTAISYNGQAMTSAVVAGSSRSRVDVWYLVNPSQGTFNATTTFNASSTAALTFISFNGVNTSNPLDGLATTTVMSATVSSTVSVTTTQANDWIIGGITANGVPSYTANSGQTVIYAGNCYGGTGGCATGYLANVASGTTQFQWNFSFTNDLANAVFAIQPTSGSSTISLSNSSLSYTATVGSTSTSTQSVLLTNSGGSSMNWTSTSTQSWLTITAASGTLSVSATSSLTFSVNPTGLSAGTYNATGTISAVGATNSPQTVSVALVVSSAGITQIAHVSKSSAGTTAGVNTIGANLEVLYVAYDTTAGVSDSLGNTWTLITSEYGGANGDGAMYYCFNPTTGSAQTFTAAVGYGQISMTAWSGVATSPLDQQNGYYAGTGASTIQPGSVTASQNNELIITGTTFNGNTSGATINAGFTISNQDAGYYGVTYGGAQAYLVQGTASAVNPTWTTSAGSTNTQGSSIIATFKAASSGGIIQFARNWLVSWDW